MVICQLNHAVWWFQIKVPMMNTYTGQTPENRTRRKSKDLDAHKPL